MHKAAAKHDFERAAELRDMVEDFKTTLKPARSPEAISRTAAGI